MQVREVGAGLLTILVGRVLLQRHDSIPVLWVPCHLYEHANLVQKPVERTVATEDVLFLSYTFRSYHYVIADYHFGAILLQD